MKISALFSFPGLLLLLDGAAGLLFILVGLIIYLRYTKRPLTETALARLRADAARWHVPEAALPDLNAVMTRFVLSIAIGAGCASLLCTLVYVCLLMNPVWSSLCLFDFGSFDTGIWFFVCVLGGSFGGSLAVLRMRREARITRSDGPRRRLSDYRSPLFYLVSGGWFILFCALIFVFHRPYLYSNTMCLRQDFYIIPWHNEFAYVWCGGAFVILAGVEWLLSRIAAIPSPLVPANVPGAESIDDMFRAKIVGIVQFLIFVPMMGFGGLFTQVIVQPYNDIASLFPFVFGVCGFLLLISSGALGGRLTGWLWQRTDKTEESDHTRQL